MKAHYELAMNSVEGKKVERLRETMNAYQNFLSEYLQSKYTNELRMLYAKTESNLKKLERKQEQSLKETTNN